MEAATVTKNYLRVVKEEPRREPINLFFLNLAHAAGNLDKVIMPDIVASKVDFEPDNKDLSILDGMGDDDKAQLIQRIVRTYYGITPNHRTRKQEQVIYRFVSMYFMKQNTKLSLSQIGSYFGDKDHATVLNALNVANNWIETEKNFRNDIEELKITFGL